MGFQKVARAGEFAPVKNAPGAATDTPASARAALLAQGAEWATAAGAHVGATAKANGIEVSALLSYSGETDALRAVVLGKCFDGAGGAAEVVA